MKKIELTVSSALDSIFDKYGIKRDNIVNICIGYEDRIYFLLENDSVKDGSCGKVKGHNYSALILDADFYNCEIIGNSFVELGYFEALHEIRPLGDDLLLVDARCSGYENNAFILNKDRRSIKELCFGDGIADLIVTETGEIITSYFDEGIFSDCNIKIFGDTCGIAVWDRNGNIIWNSDRTIIDCYAANIDECGNLWYYYYNDFKLVRSDIKKHEKEYSPGFDYADGFLISADMRHIIFRKKQNNEIKFTSAEFEKDRLKNHEESFFYYNGEPLVIKYSAFLKSEAVLVDAADRLFLYRCGY